MSFKIHLFLASVRLSSRALRLWLAATALRVSAAVLALSKRIGPPPLPVPPPNLKSAIPSAPMTVDELLSTAQRYPDPHFVLRMPGLLIEITQVDEVLESAAFNSGSEGHPSPRGQRPFFLSRRSVHDKVT